MTARKHTGLAWGSIARDVSSRGVRLRRHLHLALSQYLALSGFGLL